MNEVGTFPFVAEPFKCDFSQHLTFAHLGNYMLNAADFHADERKFGYLDLINDNKAWVLSRFVMDMAEMPMSYDSLRISTWVESAMKFFTRRNWAVEGADGKVYGYGSSVWAMIDINTRQPVNIFSVNDGCMSQYVAADKHVPIDSPSRVSMDEKSARMVGEIDTRYSDIDINGHVNSVRYIEHAIDLLSLEWHRTHNVRRIEVAYVAESYYGDKLRFYLDEQDGKTLCYMICRLSPEGEEREVCRVKIICH